MLSDKIVYVYNGCLGIKSCSNLQGKIFWSCKTCSLTFAAVILALDSISVIEKKIECVDSLIRDVALLRSEMALLRKPNFPFPNATETGFDRNRIDSSTSSQSISGSKKRKAEEIVLEPTQKKLRPFKEVKKGTNTCSSILSGATKPPR